MRSEPLATGLQGVWLEWQPGEWEHFDASNTGGVIPTQMNLMKTYLDAAGNVYLWGTADERSGPHIAQNVLRTGRRATNTWFSYAVTPGNIQQIYVTTTGMIYAATTAGLVMRDGNAAPTAAWTTISGAPNNTVQALASNGDEWLYVGTTAGIARYNRQTQTWGTTYNTANQAALPSNDITSLDVAADGKVYIGTSAGVAIWNTVTNTWQGPYTSSNSAMNSNAVRQIYANSQGIVYTLTSLPTMMTITPTDLTVWNPTNPTVLLHHYDVTHDFAGYRASDFYLNPSDTALYLGQQSGGLVRINLS